MMKFVQILLFALLCAGSAHAQGNQCRTATVGASTPNCASEAFVTESVAGAGNVTGPNSSAAGDIPSFSDGTGKVLQDSGIPSTALPTTGGTKGQQLVSNGGSSNPTFQSGGWVLLNTLTASNSPNLQDTTTFTSTYAEYLVVLENIVPATSGVSCQLQVHTGGSFQSSSYSAGAIRSASTTVASAGQTTNIPCDAGSGNAGNGVPGVNAEMMVYNPSSTTTPKHWTGLFSEAQTTTTLSLYGSIGGSWTGGNGAIDGFLIAMSSGNITSGKVKIYGRL